MLNIVPEKTMVYILSPATVAGGVETLHQLCHLLNNLCVDAKMVYIGPSETMRPSRYDIYDTPQHETGMAINDNHNTVIVVPEIFTDRLAPFRKSQKVIYWLGNFYGKNYRDDDKTVFHFAHGSTVFFRLHQRGFSNVHMINDYIDSEYLRICSHWLDNGPMPKKRKIIYCTYKMPDIINPIIDYYRKINDDAQWIGIDGTVSTEEIFKLYCDSMMYVEMGVWGRGRMLREAIACGCLAITLRSGSGLFYDDTMFNKQYKIEGKPTDALVLHALLDNYYLIEKDFDIYRRKLFSEQSEMELALLPFIERRTDDVQRQEEGPEEGQKEVV